MNWLTRLLLLGPTILGVLLLISSVFLSQRPARLNEVAVVVEVRNGCGVSGLGDRVAGYLRDRGFDVIFVGNAEDFEFAESMVVDRAGERAKALEVASYLGGIPVVQQVSSGTFVDVTVILGQDFEGFE